MMAGISVLIVDDQELLREGIRTLLDLEPGIRIAGTAEDGRAAVQAFETLAPDVVLMDIRMPNLDGIEATRAILAKHPDARILVLSTFAEDQLLFGALRAGARGYLLKDASAGELAAAVRQVHEGKAALEPGLALKLVEAVNAGRSSEAESKQGALLSRREREVLKLIAEGFSNKEIAERLFLAEGTVKNRVSDILLKIDARDRTQAALRARELGLL